MYGKLGTALVGTVMLALPGQGASAQDAAESAAILSGSSQTGSAQRSLGSSITRSINRASNAIASQPRPQRQQQRRSTGVRVGHPLSAGVDVLEGTDAATYRLGNGAAIRTTGRINPEPVPRCEDGCDTREP